MNVKNCSFLKVYNKKILTNVTKKSKTEIIKFIYFLYICKGYKMIKLRKKDSFDNRINEIYGEKVTVNLDSNSSCTPEQFWDSMELIAINNKAAINFSFR